VAGGLVLGSGSPRRREVLARLGLEFEVRVPEIEEHLEAGEAPSRAAGRLSRLKALAVPRADGEVVLAADTLVALEGHTLGKPLDGADAVRMLARLAGREHSVFTGLTLVRGDRAETLVEETRVWIRPLARAECEEYVATGEPLDKAGAYAIQGFGAAIVERIEGDYFNVMGLPVNRLLTLLGRFGVRYAFGSLRPE